MVFQKLQAEGTDSRQLPLELLLRLATRQHLKQVMKLHAMSHNAIGQRAHRSVTQQVGDPQVQQREQPQLAVSSGSST